MDSNLIKYEDLGNNDDNNNSNNENSDSKNHFFINHKDKWFQNEKYELNSDQMINKVCTTKLAQQYLLLLLIVSNS